MRQLSFTGFLRRYLLQLSARESLRICVLSDEADEDNPRLREPLLLYAIMEEKGNLLLRTVRDESLKCEFERLIKQYPKSRLEDALRQGMLGAEYQKVWDSYQSVKNRVQSDNHSKELMRARLMALQKEKGLSTYRIYTDLQLNPGNLNAWVKNGDGNKVSLGVARRVLDYARQYH